MRKKILILAIAIMQLTVTFAAVPVVESKKDMMPMFQKMMKRW
jgi:hypothetical protein